MLINDPTIVLYSSAYLDDGGGNLDGDYRGFIDDKYYGCSTSINLDDKFYDAIHLTSKWFELKYLDKWLRL